MKKLITLFFISLLASCSNDDTNNVTNNENYFYGGWNITVANRETGENLLILCSNGELPSYTFTSNNELNTLLYLGSASNTGPCQNEVVFYNYAYNPETKILTYTNPIGNGSEYKSEVIEMSENRFKTRYISGNINMQITVPNFIRVYERK